jgi:hypothetical protein
MKFTRFTFALALGCSLTMAGAWAAPPGSRPLRYASDYSYFGQERATPSPSDAPAAPAAPAAPKAIDEAPAGCAAAAACEAEEATCDPWRLFPEFGCGWTFTGFINVGAAVNADSPASHYNGPVTFFDREDVRLSQLYAVLEKAADPGECGSDWGARVDFLFGTDYLFTQATGLETHQDGSNKWNSQSTNIPGAFAMYGLAMPQAYLEYAVRDLSLKFGHFYAPVGYEVVPANGNFFVTHAYTMQYGEPFTMTGLLATWKYNDRWSFQLGGVNGWDKFDAQTDIASLVFTFTYTPDHGRYTIFNSTVVGEEDGTVLPTVGQRFVNTFVFTFDVTDNLQYVLQNDIGEQEDGIGAGVDAEWYGLNQYLFYTVNDCWKLGIRGEWFRDDDGYRLQTAPVRLGGAANVGLAGTPDSLAGNYYNLALGANWTPTANLNIRPEVRWDWSDGTPATPFDDFTKDSQFVASVDAILLY